jgi:hypothetical protein
LRPIIFSLARLSAKTPFFLAFGQDVVVVVDIHVEPGALGLGQLEAFLVGQACMLDRVDPGAQGVVDPGRAMGMGRHAHAQHVRLVGHGLEPS